MSRRLRAGRLGLVLLYALTTLLAGAGHRHGSAPRAGAAEAGLRAPDHAARDLQQARDDCPACHVEPFHLAPAPEAPIEARPDGEPAPTAEPASAPPRPTRSQPARGPPRRA